MDVSDDSRFAVWAEVEGYSKPLLVIDLTGGRLFDDIVVPYQAGQIFFVDGTPVKPPDLRRIKILRQQPGFDSDLKLLHRTLSHGDVQRSKVFADQYHVRLEAIVRGRAEDVTSQIIKAYDQAIKPKLKDYLPKRDEANHRSIEDFL
jgi:hypothetical protein